MSVEKPKKNVFLKDGTPVDRLIVKMLNKRGLHSTKEINRYLEPQLTELPKPELMLDLEKAAAIIGNAIIQKGPILIWGDYDVDGTTATALLLLFFKKLGHKQVEYYIPNRLSEGYGLQSESLEKLSNKKTLENPVLITVDNGISAHSAVKTAKNLGYKIVVTDHHTPPEIKVGANAILNPKQPDCDFPGKNLAGVGVAFYLAIGIRTYLQSKAYFEKRIPLPNMKQFLDLVAIGTVADMVVLDETNRILVRAGLETVAAKTNPGVEALCVRNNLDSSLLRSEDISFQIAPKINATGRLGNAEMAVRLLTTCSQREADKLCAHLIRSNEIRKSITLNDLSKAIYKIEGLDTSCPHSIVVTGDFNIGVAGIVASNLVDKYNKPTVILCEQRGSVYKGSARSIEGIDLHNILEQCKGSLISFGGHAMAAGMSIKETELHNFKVGFDNAILTMKQNSRVIVPADKQEEVSVCKLFEERILKQLLLLEPHGPGNPQPVFVDQTSSIEDIRRIGSDKSHLKLTVSSGTSVINAIAFGMGELYEKCTSKHIRQIVYSPATNFFRGKRSWQARVVCIQFSDNN
jgi:single-stranded-DNA-specific exonuclease